MMTPRRSHLLAACLLAALVAGGYWNSLGNRFVLDDYSNIVENAALKDVSAIPRLGTTAYFDLAGPVTFYYRPLATLSFFADYALWGVNPLGFHLTNLLLHIGTSLLVYALFVLLLGRWDAALFGAALFAAHPVLTESVNYISGGRNVLLSTGLVLLALCGLLGWTRGRPWRLVAGLLAYALALLTKESAVVVLVLLPLIDWARAENTPVAWRERLPLYAAVALITAGYLVIRLGVMNIQDSGGFPSLAERLRVWPYATWLHLRQLVVPLDLSAHYVFQTPQTATDPMVLFPVAILAALLLGLVWLWVRGQRLACLGVGWVLIALGPVSNLVPFAAVGIQPVAERFLYLPAVGFSLLLTLALLRLRHTGPRLGLVGAFLVTYATLTVYRNPVWHDNLTLWEHTVERVPGSPWAHANIGLSHEQRGDLARAVRAYALAGDLFVHDYHLPVYAVTAYQRAGETALKQERLHLAAHHFRQVLRLAPRHGPALVHLGLVYHRQGREAEAVAAFEAARQEPAQ